MDSRTTAPRGRRAGARAALVALALVPAVAVGAAEAGNRSAAESEDFAYAHTCGHLGVPCLDQRARALKVRVSPARVARGATVRLRLRVKGAAAPRAIVRVAGRRLRADKRGRVVLQARFSAPGRERVTARVPGRATAHTWIRVID